MKVSKSHSQDRNIAEIQLMSLEHVRRQNDGIKTNGIYKGPALNFGKDGGTPSQPKEEQHSLQNQVSLLIAQLEMPRIMTEKVAHHVQHESHRRGKVQDGRDDGMPKALAVDLVWMLGRYVFIHGYCDADQLLVY